MRTPIEQLLAEHRIIEKVLHALTGLSERLERGEHIDRAEFDKLFAFLSAFADGRHHRKEERCLFPALGLHGIARDHGPIGTMLQEHCTGRALVAHMKRAAVALGNGDGKSAAQFAELARNYVDLQSEHIRKEDTMLFRLAEELLDERAMRNLQDDFDEVESYSSEAHARYEREAAELERAWAVQTPPVVAGRSKD